MLYPRAAAPAARCGRCHVHLFYCFRLFYLFVYFPPEVRYVMRVFVWPCRLLARPGGFNLTASNNLYPRKKSIRARHCRPIQGYVLTMLLGLDCGGCCCCLNTLNRSFYPTTSAVPPVSFLILHPREIQIMWSKTETEE